MPPKQRPLGRTPRARRSAAAAQVMSLFQVSSSLVAVLDPEHLFSALVSRVVEALPSVQGGTLWIYDPKSGRLRASATAGLPIDSAARQMLLTISLRSGEGMVGQSLQRGEPQIVETLLGYRDTVGPLPPASAMIIQQVSEQLPRRLACTCIPMRVGTEIVGVLELFMLGEPTNDSAVRPIEQGDLPVLQIFANLAASAIKNTQLYDEAQRSERRLKAFDAVVTAISTAADLTDLVRSVLNVVLGLVPCSTGALLLLDPAHDRLDLGAQQGLTPACASVLTGVRVSESPCEEVVHFGQPMLRPLLEERGEALFLAEGLVGCAYFPLLAGGTVAGVLAIYGDSDLPARADREMLLPICNQVGFAVANVRLYADSTGERRKLNTVVTSIAEGVLLCDRRGHLTLANEAALTLLRLNSLPFEQRLSEMPDFYRMRDLDSQRLTLDQLPFARALAGEIFQDYRLILSGSSGDETVMSFSGAPARADDGSIEGAVVVFRDVTANQKLERAKDEFLAVAAHELRSPLAAVRNYADLLLRREQQRSQADSRDLRGLTILTQQVSHMLRMVDNLLDVSRIDAGQIDLQIQPVNLVALAAQVIDQQRPAAGARDLVLESAADELFVPCDSLRIHQVMTNLIGNAIKYSPDTGRVTVRLWVATNDDRRVFGDHLIGEGMLGTSGATEAAVVSVTDEGNGIVAEQQTKLFQRFYRVRSHRAEGLGLGLYLSRQFIQMHHGAIWVESVEGAGNTFSFALPMTMATGAQQ
ncbi:MAG: ATP-binding protein [Chloroflexales bacterium]